MIQVVLYQPEIPQNTGNIMRTCAATGTKLHLIEPLGFSLDEKQVRRSGANYVEFTDYTIYPTFEAFIKANPTGVKVFFTRYANQSPSDLSYTNLEEEYYLIFGSESSGIPKEILQMSLETCVRFPMKDVVRSLNLSNTVAMAVYEALRQQGYPGLISHEPDTLKGKDYLTRK
jgi:tRNA (cytidine/uridine-2'-O-)-methyltransferase